MSKISKSPERHTFQQEGAIKRAEEKGEEPNHAYIDMWEQIKLDDANKIHDPAWQHNNLEYDLRSTEWILEKARASESYAQNIYAALCNQGWINIKGLDPQVTLDILKGQYWSCSWRHAGGIVADMRESGDYINWYCSGIGNSDDGYGLSSHKPDLDEVQRTYVSEGIVTDEIRKDFQKLGWALAPESDDT
jgi:hypothetical protein